jgi:uncharacterized membrane protein
MDFENNNRSGKDPDNYVWGIFYFNKNDHRLFLLKRAPALGVTVNFANPLAYLFLAILFLLMALSAA